MEETGVSEKTGRQNSASTVWPTPADLQPLRELYERGLYLQAHARAQALGSYRLWRGTSARVFAVRLTGNLGAHRLARALCWRAWREAPFQAEARCYWGYHFCRSRSPLAALEYLRATPELPDAAADLQAAWLAQFSEVLGRLRDFAAAEEHLARAERLSPEDEWLCVERAMLFSMEDRPEEALAAARRALEFHPWYRPAVMSAAETLSQLDRLEEAVELLSAAGKVIESGAVASMEGAFRLELGDYAAALAAFNRSERLSPLMEQDLREWVDARRCDASYYAGDLRAAAEYARRSGPPYYDELAKRLEEGQGGCRRVLLPVPFVRQHHLTCGPATLAALSRYWSRPVDHLELAAEICYDGTSALNERDWAERNGFAAREFTVTAESAAALVDRRLPFTLGTMDLVSGHLQAAIGYDPLRKSLYVREPSQRDYLEYRMEEFLKRYQSCGPRGMVVAPVEERSRLEELELPECRLYERLFRLERALQRHDRAAAAAESAALQAESPDGRLTWQARLALANYDADATERLVCAEGMLKLHPQEGRFALLKLNVLREMGRHEDRVAFLQEWSRPPKGDPVFWQQYADELRVDARRHGEARELLRRALRLRPYEAQTYHILGDLLWERREFERALECYRFAVCLDDKDEHLAEGYFLAGRYLRKTWEALKFLEERVTRYAARSSRPVRTYFQACEQLDLTVQGFAALERGLTARPEDGDLRLFAAQANARYGRFDQAQRLLEEARGRSRRNNWLRAAAHIAGCRGEPAAALALWRELSAAEPLAEDVQRQTAQRLAETEGRSAAAALLRERWERFPHHFGTGALLAEWLQEDDLCASETVLRALAERHPLHAWPRRRLGWNLLRQDRCEEALKEAEAAAQLEPTAPDGFSLRGRIRARQGKLAEARALYREAIRLSVDEDFAIAQLVRSCDTPEEKREALAFVRGELIRQVIYGEGLLQYRVEACEALSGQEVLATLREGHAARPDLWHSWAALIQQLTDLGQLDEAWRLAQEATARFPLHGRLWLEHAAVCQARGDAAGERAALEQALQVAPGFSAPARQLSELLEKLGERAAARQVLERAVAAEPLDGLNHAYLANVIWKLGEKETAFARLERAIMLDPSYEWVWRTLRSWGGELKRPEAAPQLARDLTKRRAGEPRVWLILAQVLQRPEALNERLAALDRALELHPRYAEAHDLKAELLAQAKRWDEALAACRPLVWKDALPLELRGRAAWVTAERGAVEQALAQMETLTLQNPDYYWGWMQIAEWREKLERWPQHLAAAQQLIRISPRNCAAWGVLAFSRLKNHDRAGAKEAFHRSAALDPEYAFGHYWRFDLLLEDGELEEAERVSQSLLHHLPGPFSVARRVQLLAKQAKKEEALAGFEELTRTETGEDDRWPLGAAVEALDKADLAKEADQVLTSALFAPATNPLARELWTDRMVWRKPGERNLDAARELTVKRPGEVQSWLAVAKLLDGPAALPDRLAALDRARELDRGNWRVQDLRAELLAEVGRYQEALAATAVLQPAPIPLQGRAALILYQRGDREEAVQRMEGVVRELPSYTFGWRRLCDWYEELKRPKDCLRVAEQLAKAAPDECTSYGYLGQARLSNGDRAGAEEAWRKSLDLSPDYRFGATALFDVCFEDGELQACQTPLELLLKHHPGYAARGCQVRLFARLGQTEEALRGFEELGCDAEATEETLKQAYTALKKADRKNKADEILSRLLKDPRAQPVAGAFWAMCLAENGQWRMALRALARPEELGPGGPYAAATLLDALAEGRDRRVLGYLRRHAEWLKKHPRTWAAAGRALIYLGQARGALDWLRDWRKRPGLEAWMLVNVAEAHLDLSEDEEAQEAHRAALLLTRDHSTTWHTAWVALHEALAGQEAAARERLAAVNQEELDYSQKLLCLWTKTLLEALRLGPDRPYAALRGLKSELAPLQRVLAKDVRNLSPFRRARARVVRILAARQPWLVRWWMRLTW